MNMPDLSTLARWLIILGMIILAIGGILWLIARSGLPLGKLPGDIQIETKGLSCFIPLVSSILLSIILTILFNLILRIINK